MAKVNPQIILELEKLSKESHWVILQTARRL